jgi:hypothetical protein
MANISTKEVKEIAEEAYIFSFPMLMGFRFAFATFLTPSLPSYRGPANAMHGKAATLDHTFRDVITPNADTPYSMALLDLRAEPVVIQVPRITDRYYVLQFEDLFGTNAHYIGSRATGSQAGTYLAVGPRWESDAGDKFNSVFTFETDLVFVIGRTQLLGVDDVPDLTKVMDGYIIQTLSTYLGKEAPPNQPVEWPIWNDDASRDERFIGYLNFLLSFCQPTHPSETELMARFAKIGIGAGLVFDTDTLDDDSRSAIRSGVHAAREKIDGKVHTMGQEVNGWGYTNVFGTREWYNGDYLLRAAGAMAGWGGNDAIEAFYPIAREDASGEPFDGAHRYQITFTTLPPAKAFWSVTMYDTSYDGTAGYLVENPISRYLINSTTEGLVYGEDDSLTIYIQHEQPTNTTEKANWLPAPEGLFYLTMRIYWPEQAALDGTWRPPLVKRIE